MEPLRTALSVESDPSAVAERAATLFVDAGREAIAARRRFTVALTGGSSPLELYARLASEPRRGQVDWSRTELFWGDERAVPPDDPNSNYGAAKRALLDKLPLVPSRVHRMPGERPDLEAAASEYAATLASVAGSSEPTLDLILVGVGANGHILSLYPGCPEIVSPTGSVVALRHPPMNPPLDRLSITPPVLWAARRVVVLAYGAGKAAALGALFDPSRDERAVPVKLVARCRGALTILADHASAVGLDARA